MYYLQTPSVHLLMEVGLTFHLQGSTCAQISNFESVFSLIFLLDIFHRQTVTSTAKGHNIFQTGSDLLVFEVPGSLSIFTGQFTLKFSSICFRHFNTFHFLQNVKCSTCKMECSLLLHFLKHSHHFFLNNIKYTISFVKIVLIHTFENHIKEFIIK